MKRIQRVIEILAIFAFVTYISIENHSLNWTKENKIQNNILD